jgi:DNA-binding ferritin-like protein
MLLEKVYGNAQTFENQYKQLRSIDEIAERISKLGGKLLVQ